MDRKEGLYRHELKYLISQAQLSLLKNRIAGIMQLDPYVSADGMYNVRSLYFDDYYNSCYYENQNSVDPREKFRLRIYEHSSEHISLECKRKERGKTIKTSCLVTMEQAQAIMQAKAIPITEDNPPVLNKMLLQTRTRRLRPAVIVEYERIPYVYKNGNVRITFDTNMASSSHIAGFLEPVLPQKPIMPPGWHLMEVKFDEYLPDFIYTSLNLESLQQTPYSKYYLSRKYASQK